MRSLTAILFATSLLTACAVESDEVDDTIGENGEEIIGGSIDYGDPNVAFIRSPLAIDAAGKPTTWGVCTGTLIAPNILLTAAHCKLNGTLWADAHFGTQPSSTAPASTGGWISGTFVTHPAWNGDIFKGNDIALFLLSQPIGAPTVKRGPTPASGTSVRAIGYGMNVFGNNGVGTGTKRHIVLGVGAATSLHFAAGQDGQNVCHGDSGGPVLQNGRIVGVSDYVDTADCHGAGHFTRLEQNLSFIRMYVPAF